MRWVRALAGLAMVMMTLGCAASPSSGSDASPTLVPAPAGCRQDDVRSQIEALFAAIDRGDPAALDKLLSTDFRGYAIGSPEPRSLIKREDAIAYLAERPRVGESLSLASITVNPYILDGNVGFQLKVDRQLRALRTDHEGKGAVYCGSAQGARGIMVLAFGNGQ